MKLAVLESFGHNLICICTLVLGLACSTSEVNAQAEAESYFRIFYANDFFRARDLYYTQGVRLEWRKVDWAFLLTREGFTPASIVDPDIRVGDHPYAGVTYLGAKKSWNQFGSVPNRKLFVQGFLGFIGPASGGKQEQTTIHRWIDDELPLGWDNQIANDLILDVMVGYDRMLFQRRYVDLEIGALARLGTYRTRFTLNGHLRLGLVQPKQTKKGKSFALAYRVSPVVHVIGYDATLQGGVFNDSPYTVPSGSVSRLVGRIHTSLEMRLGSFGASFGHTYQTRRISTIDPHAWGEITLVWYGTKKGQLLGGEINVN